MVSVRSRPAPFANGDALPPRPRGAGRLRPPVTMIECDFCGCSSPKYDKGWMAYPDDDVAGAPGILIYCRSCAFAVLGHSLDEALDHVCNFEPQPLDVRPEQVGPGDRGLVAEG